jgi:hypothetical protein
MSLKKRILVIFVSFSMYGCVAPKPIYKSYIAKESVSELSKRLARLADNCWSRGNNFWTPGRLVEFSDTGSDSAKVSLIGFASDIGRYPILDVAISNKNGKTVVDTTEHLRNNAGKIVKAWVDGSTQCMEIKY